jgi:hypothetical protein
LDQKNFNKGKYKIDRDGYFMKYHVSAFHVGILGWQAWHTFLVAALGCNFPLTRKDCLRGFPVGSCPLGYWENGTEALPLHPTKLFLKEKFGSKEL